MKGLGDFGPEPRVGVSRDGRRGICKQVIIIRLRMGMGRKMVKEGRKDSVIHLPQFLPGVTTGILWNVFLGISS